MKSRQGGFTLIELVMVIVIIGVLAAIAVPRFLDLSGDARQSAVNSVAGSISSGMANNYAAKAASSATASTVTDCSHADLVVQGGLPSGYTVAAAAIPGGAGALKSDCVVTGPALSGTAASAAFTGVATQ